jgi:hypothetical protein
MAAVLVCVVLVMVIGLYAQPLIDLVSRSVTVLALIP